MKGGLRLLSVLGVQGAEGRLVGLLLGLYFVLISALVLIQSMAFGLFIANYGPERLPYAYLAIALLASLVAFAYLRIGERVSFGRQLEVNLAFLCVGSLVLWGLLGTLAAPWVVFLLPVWFQIFVTLANLVVWPLALRLFDVRQSKRVFGLIGAGTWLANVLGGLVVGPLVAAVGPANLLPIAAGIVIGAWFVLRVIVRDYPAEGPPTVGSGTPRRRSSRPPLGAYAWRIFAFVALWWLAFYFVDNIFFAQAADRYLDATQLTAFIGRFLAVTGAVALVTTVAVTSRVLGRFGLTAGLLAMPVIVVSTVASLAVLGAWGASAALLFWLAALAKLSNLALGFSLSQTANTVMYQALPAPRRERVQTLAEGVVQPLAVGAAGVILLVLTTLGGLDAIGLAWILLPIGVLWLVAGYRVARAYPATLAQVLLRRRWGRDGAIVDDAAGRALLRRHLTGEHPGAVIYAFEQLASHPGAVSEDDIAALVSHPALDVRAATLGWLEAHPSRSSVHVLRDLLAVERVPALEASALRALGAIGGAAAVEVVGTALERRDRVVRAGAVVGLLRSRDEAAVARARRALESMVGSPSPGDRAEGAHVIAVVGGDVFVPELLTLLRDGDAGVRVAALAAAPAATDPRVWSTVARLAGERGSASAAQRALVRGGGPALDAVERELAESDPFEPHVLVLVRACASIGGPRAVRVLAGVAHAPVAAIRVEVLAALAAQRQALDPVTVRAQLPECRERMSVLEETLASTAAKGGAVLLDAALERAWRREQDIVLLLLAHVLVGRGDDPTAMLDARAALVRGETHRSAQALEVIDTQIPAELRRTVLPMLEASPRRDVGGIVRVDRAAPLLADLVAGPPGHWYGTWTRACALHAIGELDVQACADVVVEAEGADDAVINETARWARRRLDRRRTAEPHEGGVTPMLSILERVLVLKTVGIFGGTPDDVLADVASVLEEVDVEEGTVVFEQGDVGDSLYVVVEGLLDVLDGGAVIDTLGEREVFGEMALLDPEPRVASVRAAEATKLLRLDQAPFVEILHDRPEIAVAIMRVLTRRLRSRVRDLAAVGGRPRGAAGDAAIE